MTVNKSPAVAVTMGHVLVNTNLAAAAGVMAALAGTAESWESRPTPEFVLMPEELDEE